MLLFLFFLLLHFAFSFKIQASARLKDSTLFYYYGGHDFIDQLFCVKQALNAASNSAQMKTETQRAQAIEVDDIVLEQNQSCNMEGNNHKIKYNSEYTLLILTHNMTGTLALLGPSLLAFFILCRLFRSFYKNRISVL